MSARTANPKSSKSVSPAIVGGAVIVLIAFIGWIAWINFAPPPGSNLPPPPKQEIAFIEQKARECQGDIAKLSPADQAKVNDISKGFGPANMASTWRHLNKPKN